MGKIHISAKFPLSRYFKYSEVIAGVVLAGATSTQADLITVVVPATSDPYLAGMPDGSTASYTVVAPDQSPVLVPSLVPQAGEIITFTNVTGLDSWNGDTPFDPPDGESDDILGHLSDGPSDSGNNPENGIGDMYAPIDSLVGVFLGSVRPDSGDPTPPPPLDFWPIGTTPTAIGLDFPKLSPLLYQPFFIGDGMTSGDVVQQFTVPTGATRLFLGTMDGYQWNDNAGGFTADVNVVPEPASLSLLILAGGTILLRRRHNEAPSGCSV